MKFVVVALLVCFLAFAFVAAAPAQDETIVGGLWGADEITNPQDSQEILKKLLLKKKLLLLG